MTFYLGALILGFMGSLHCVGMCGPLVAAMPIGRSSLWSTSINTLTYHGARFLSYGLLGLLPGMIGEGLKFTGMQQWVSMGIGLLFILIFVLLIIKGSIVHLPAWNRWSQYIQNLITPWLHAKGRTKLIALGALNGLIPCGLTYMAMASALTATQVMDGVLFMMVFGLGTFPALASITLFKHYNATFFRASSKYLIPMGYLIVGALLIYRGIFVDVPMDLRILKEMGWESTCH